MKVCLDIQSAVSQRAGVGRYTQRLAASLCRLPEIEDLRMFYFDFKRKCSPDGIDKVFTQAVHWCPGGLANLLWKNINWPPFNWFADPADVYHFPNFTLPPLSRGKSVVTIHDMSFLRFPQFAEKRNLKYLTARIRATANNADAIITDSAFSAAEIEELLRVERNRIFSIHLGIDQKFVPPPPAQQAEILNELKLDRPYLLTVGTVEPRKNIPFLIEVFEALTDFQGQLVIAGMPGWKVEPIFERIKNSRRAADIRYLRYVQDEHLPALYSGAELFCIASHYEGFGFPPLEAMACGTPVISSTGGSLPEVLGNAACLVPDFNGEEWLTRIRHTLSDSTRRQDLIEKGLQKAAEYDWKTTAQKTYEVYKSIAR